MELQNFETKSNFVLISSGCIGKPEQTIDLYLQSKCTLDQLLDQVDLSDVCNSINSWLLSWFIFLFKDLLDQPAIMIYLEWILSATKEVIDCSQVCLLEINHQEPN